MNNKILLDPKIGYVGYGDRLDALGIAKLLNLHVKKPVEIYQRKGRFKDFDKMKNLFKVDATIHYEPVSDILSIGFMKHGFFETDSFSLIKANGFPQFNLEQTIDLPEKFVTMQFDGNKYSHVVDRILRDKIVHEYKNLGYEVLFIGGSASDKRFNHKHTELATENTIQALQKADHHIGVDSAMMHLAKFCMEPKNIITYVGKYEPQGLSSFSYILRELGMEIRVVE